MTKRLSGGWGEDAALAWARGAGMRLVARNFRCRGGELDLVLREGRRTLVFCEVRARRAGHGAALASIGPAKQRRVFRAAVAWMSRAGVRPGRLAVRFDVCSVAPGPEVRWLRGAFSAPPGLG